MSSPIDKKFGDMFVHGRLDDKVNLVLSAHGFELEIGLLDEKIANELMMRWDALKDEAERLSEYEWMYKDLSE